MYNALWYNNIFEKSSFQYMGEYICNSSWTKRCRPLCWFQLDENRFTPVCLWKIWQFFRIDRSWLL